MLKLMSGLEDTPKQKNEKSIKVQTYNFQSIKNKLPEFSAIIEEDSPDVVLGSETWLKGEIKNSELPMNEEYDIFRRDRSPGKDGGGYLA